MENTIECISKDGEINYFKYDLEKDIPNTMDGEDDIDEGELKFKVSPADPNINEIQRFTLNAILHSGKYVKIVSMFNQKNLTDTYSAKGIPDKLIELLHEITGRTVTSSSNTVKTFDNEWQSDAARKVWERLESKGRARFDEEKAVFVYVPDNSK